MAPTADPRAIITPESFGVSPSLLGLPLARPWRRLGAMLLDLILVAILSAAGGLVLAVAAAAALWRASTPRGEQGRFGTGIRRSLRVAATAVLFVAVWSGWDDVTDTFSGESIDPSREAASIMDLEDLALLPPVIALSASSDTAVVRGAARELASSLGSMGPNARAALSGLEGDVTDSVARDILAAALGPTTTSAAAPDDSAVLRLADALSRGDSDAIETLRPMALAALAADSIDRLAEGNRRLRESNAALGRRLVELEERGSGFLGFLRGIADDLGLGLGWGALYFSSLLALWGGRTPGKRIFGIRVIRLDGRPLTWWSSFERFGGYAASLSTGLLGFAQILWDRNRQALHDKAVETVVIREGVRGEG